MTETQDEQEKTSDAAGCVGKTFQAHSHPTSGGTSNPSSRKSSASQSRRLPLFLYLKKDGHTQDASWESMENGRWPTERWTQNSGESPSDAPESTLSQILQEQPHPKYSLSATACLGILRRADKRGKTIIPILRQALERQAAAGGHDLGIRPIVLDNHPQDSRIGIREDGMSPTLTEKMGTGGNNVPMVMEPIPINDKATRHDGGGSTRNSDGAGNGLGIRQPGDPSPTLTAADRHGVAYALDRAAFNQGENALFGIAVEEELSPTIVAKGPNAVIQPTAVPEISGTLTAKMAKGTGGPAGDEMQNLVAEFPDYIVRRFTPLECGRLQGFPDWWTDSLGIEQPTFWEVARWLQIFQTYWEVVSGKGGAKAPKTKNQVIKWLQNPASDSALYKMWGNGIALPCAMFVMAGIAKAAGGDESG